MRFAQDAGERFFRLRSPVEQYLVRNFRYLPNTASATSAMTIEDFLLRRREGHCEYFAAGMVVLRIVPPNSRRSAPARSVSAPSS